MSKQKFGAEYFAGYRGTNMPWREFARQHLGVTPKVPALLKAVRLAKPDARILDVGCGLGGLLEQLESLRDDVYTYGIDLGTPPQFRSRGSFLRGNVLRLPFADNSFDIVTCAHMLEHLQDPHHAVTELVRVCRPGGTIYLETPSPRATLLPFGFNFWDDPTHVRPHSKTSLLNLLETSACVPMDCGTKKSLPAILLGLPYMLLGHFLNDPQARVLFPLYAFGCVVWAMGKKNAP